MVNLLDLSWETTGLIKGDKIINTLIELVGNQLIEDLPIPFTAVAANVQREKEVWIQSGKLFDAVRASISLPLFFTPYNYKGIDLIDGGVLNPVPIAPTFGDGTDLTIAVNLGGAIEVKPDNSSIKTLPENSASPLRQKVGDFIDRFQQMKTSIGNIDWGVYDIANQAFDAMQSTIARQKLAAYPPDHLIEIARNACGTLEFDRASEMINLGYSKAQESLGSRVTPL